MRRNLSPLAILLLGACTVGPDYKMPEFETPKQWFADAKSWFGDDATAAEKEIAAPTKIDVDWWRLFNDSSLTALEEEGLKANDDIVLAAARVAEARAVLHLNEAQQYPNLSAEAGATRTGPSEETRSGALGSSPYNEFGVSAVLNYEVDLWGRLRRSTESARAQLLSEQANRNAVTLAVTSDIATGYFNLLALDAQLAVTRDTIASRQSSFDYQQKQYKAGAVDVLSFQRAQAELAAAQATLPVIEQARVEQQNALAILLGRSPKAMVETPIATGKALTAMPVPPTMPLDAPSTLLERRPDVTAAEQQLIAANAQIGVAKADYYPTLSLSALLGLASSDIDNLLQSSARQWQVGASSAVPVLDFGRTSANVDAATARKDQAMANYKQVVRGAFADVANALSAVQTTQARTQAQLRQVQANEETVRVAGLRYNAGYATQLDQLDAQRQLFQAQLDSIDAMRDRLTATVSLYKALGGGWNTAPAIQPTETPIAGGVGKPDVKPEGVQEAAPVDTVSASTTTAPANGASAAPVVVAPTPEAAPVATSANVPAAPARPIVTPVVPAGSPFQLQQR